MGKVMTLDQLSVGEQGLVEGVDSSSPQLRNKLLSFGIVPGRILEVQHFAPLGDPMTIRCSGSSLALRLSEARCISITLV